MEAPYVRKPRAGSYASSLPCGERLKELSLSGLIVVFFFNYEEMSISKK
jgi:hypothetical protein